VHDALIAIFVCLVAASRAPDFAGARTTGQIAKNAFEGIDRNIRAFSTESIGCFDMMVRKLWRFASDCAFCYDKPSGAPGPPASGPGRSCACCSRKLEMGEWPSGHPILFVRRCSPMARSVTRRQ
jgi:hypothetical protein